MPIAIKNDFTGTDFPFIFNPYINLIMNTRLTLTLLLLIVSSLFSYSSSGLQSTQLPLNGLTKHPVSFSGFINMKMKDAEKLAGKHFSLKEKIVFKIMQKRLKKQTEKIAASKKSTSSKGAKVAFILGILSLATLYFPFVSLPIAIAAIIIGQRAYKKSNYTDKKARAATTMAILAIGILLVAAFIIGIFSDASFGIFVLS